MTERQRDRAQKVVESFRVLLDKKTLETIPDNDFEQLALFVQEALSDELHDAAEQVEELARKMRSGTSLSDVGMDVM
ncbi:hypothetical protein [Thiohalomonas denitrificans]|uniref:Uncharacterized protein n=1 Tax=Thiohalomonas denitrificans TaxID=415747 RepID=A0A1G5QMZ5_9GAMM|nr:hypothetical protein [Thiohalomonas denitrificans]SCZ63107.1 hypothetical protein SAMN03097708_02423 [Thiohalomonas denitrificans]